ncbi:carbohydrate ABC transporter permease [Sphingomonas baiyangensis]|uniref:Sugar ABC transporter permease n=1 Tax=Sphingomonas baiyangensis TaxID=2572576 RepID=A0A4V5PTH5_9SPHN|nr:sugar ABC transporter permease [Sphingomonas baiyangensis]TKD49988.1 sugar ABC transporter permease [Sphingomonas baiyangensis]
MSAAAAIPRAGISDRLLGPLLIAPVVVVLGAVIAYPLFAALALSLFAVDTLTLDAQWVGLGNFGELLGSDGRFWTALVVTLVWTAATLALQLVLGIAMALLLNRDIWMRSLARSLVLFPYFISTVVAVLVWRWLFNDFFGLINLALIGGGVIDAPVDWLGSMPNAFVSLVVVGAWKFFPFVVIAVLARLQSIPESLYEAARLDGAGVWARFRDVTLPQIGEVLGIVVLLRAIWDFKEFDLIFLLTGGGPIDATRTLPLIVYQEAFGLNRMGMAAAYAVSMMIVMLGFFAAYRAAVRGRA